MSRGPASARSTARRIAGLTAILAVAASGAVRADPACAPVSSTVSTSFVECPPEIPSLCTAGVVSGTAFNGSTFFYLTSGRMAGPNTRFEGVFMVFNESGTLTFSTTGMLIGANGRYVQTFTLVGATGTYAGGSAHLVSTGTATGTGFEGDFNGILCSAK